MERGAWDSFRVSMVVLALLKVLFLRLNSQSVARTMERDDGTTGASVSWRKQSCLLFLLFLG
jgi:hypothetical protein